MQYQITSQEERDKCKHIIFSLEDININGAEEAFAFYIIEHNKKLHYYLVESEFKKVFIGYQFSPYVTSKLSDNKTLIPWKKLLKNVKTKDIISIILQKCIIKQ